MTLSEMIGRRLGHYEIVAVLGRGGAARVYKARDTQAAREVAIKIIPNDAEDRQLFVRRFQFEIEVVRKLNHPNIVAVYDAGETDELVYLVMQCVAGGTLRERIAEGPLDVSLGVSYAVQMAQALHHAHRQGIVHRDVKPSNMLLDAADPTRALLTDFGIAKIQGLRGITKSGTTMGTPEYMSPEQSQGRESDPRTDIYSLGCVIYEMLAGRPPFKAPLPVSVLYQHVYERPPYIRGYNDAVPPELALIIETALEKNPDDRFPTADHFARALAPFTQPGYQGAASELPTDATLPPMAALPRTPPSAPEPARTRRAPQQSGPLGPWPLTLPAYDSDPIAHAEALPPSPSSVAPPRARPTSAPISPLAEPAAEPLSDLIDLDVRQALIASERLERLELPGRETAGPRRLATKTDPLRGLELPTRTPGATSSNLTRYTGAPLREDALDSLARLDTLPPVFAGAEPVRWPQTIAVEVAAPASATRRRRRPLTVALAMVALLALLAGGTLTLSATGIVAIPIPGLRAPAATPRPTLAPTAMADATATPDDATPTVSPQLADRQAYASFRSVTLGPAKDGSCAAANATDTFSAGQTIYINLCTSDSVAASSLSVSVRQTGGVCALIGLIPSGSYDCYTNYPFAPGHYDMLVTMKVNGTTGTARDLRFTVSS